MVFDPQINICRRAASARIISQADFCKEVLSFFLAGTGLQAALDIGWVCGGEGGRLLRSGAPSEV